MENSKHEGHAATAARELYARENKEIIHFKNTIIALLEVFV